MDELIGYDGLALSGLIHLREISPVELMEITIRRIESLNPEINAVVHELHDQAMETAEILSARLRSGRDADGLFLGVPFLLKDLLAESAGTPFNEGSRALRGYISKVDSELVRRQKAAGLIITGKSNTSEFGGLPIADSVLFGKTVNPWDPSRTPGGSSGGSAAAVAAGLVPMAHGNDGGGSIRIPASCCGLFGLKPTRGRNPMGPYFGDLAGGLATEHALTRTVRDSAALLDATSGPDHGDPYYAPPQDRPFLEEVERDVAGLKIGFLTSVPFGWSDQVQVHPDCLEAVEDAARLCESLGHMVEEIDPEPLGHPDITLLYGVIWSALIGHVISYWERELGVKIGPDEIEPLNWMDYQDGAKFSAADYLITMEKVQRFSRQIARWYVNGGYDLLLSPTLRTPPLKLEAIGSITEEPIKAMVATRSLNAFTRIQNLTGQPAMSVPLHWNEENVPIGVQFAGRFGEEGTLFRLAAQLERARPWADKIPPIHYSRLS